MTVDQFDNLTVQEFGAHYAELREMAVDNDRLRALLPRAEWVNDCCCPWCRKWKDDVGHAADCPAFNPDGTVK